MTDKKQGYQPEIGITTNSPNCGSGVTQPNKDRVLIFIPNDANYIEILGHRIDGFESFEAFCEHFKKYVELEETVKAQKAEIKRLTSGKCVYLSDDETTEYCVEGPCPKYKTEEQIKTEAFKEFKHAVRTYFRLTFLRRKRYEKIFDEVESDLLKGMEGEG